MRSPCSSVGVGELIGSCFLVVRQAPEPITAKEIAAFLPPGGSSLLTQLQNKTQPEGEITQQVKVSFPIRALPSTTVGLALMGNQPEKLTSNLTTLAP